MIHESMPFFFKVGEEQLCTGCGKRQAAYYFATVIKGALSEKKQKLRIGEMIPVEFTEV